MPRTRKTRDVFEVHVNYGQGWEYATAGDTRKEAREHAKSYRDNAPEYPVKIVRKREPITPKV